MIQRVQVLHKIGYIHNDIKPANILVGFKDPGVIYLIDFGISHQYVNSDGAHIKFKFQEHFSGNFLFASFNGCINKLLSRRDDITSIIILMVYLLNDKKLPWSGFKEKFEGRHFSFGDYLRERSGPTYMTGLIDMAPRSMFKILKGCLTAEFEEEPPYEELI